MLSGLEIKTVFTRYRHILKTVKNVSVAKFELAFTRYRHNLKTIENLTVTDSVQSLQEFDAKNLPSPTEPFSLNSKPLRNVLFSSFSSVHTMPLSKCAG